MNFIGYGIQLLECEQDTFALLDLEPMTCIYELDQARLKIHLLTRNEVSRSRVSKVTAKTDTSECNTTPHLQVVKSLFQITVTLPAVLNGIISYYTSVFAWWVLGRYASSADLSVSTSDCVMWLRERVWGDTRQVDVAVDVVARCLTQLYILVRKVVTRHRTTGNVLQVRPTLLMSFCVLDQALRHVRRSSLLYILTARVDVFVYCVSSRMLNLLTQSF